MNSNLQSSAASLTATSMEQTGLLPAVLPVPAEGEVGRGRGRPGLLTGELAAEMYKLIRVYGLTDSRAGLLAGASTSSVSRWKNEDEQFRDYLETARAEFELNRTLKLLEATRPDGSPDWRAHAWLLKNSQQGEARQAGRPRQSAEPAASAGAAENTQKIPENGASSRASAPVMGMETGGETTRKIPENRRSSSGLAPEAVAGPGDENIQKIPKNHAHGEDAAPRLGTTTPRPHEKIPKNQGSSAMQELREVAQALRCAA